MTNFKTYVARLVLGALSALGVSQALATPTVTYYHNDLAGSPVVATNASGQVIWRESYRPYGERLTNAPASASNDIWFTSRRQDADTGLVYMGARYYDPVVGRFYSTDPAGFVEGNGHSFNRYAYANNNPYRYADPDGREPGSLIQRGYALPIPDFSREPGLVRVAPELAYISGGIARILSTSLASGEAPIPGASSALVCRGGACTADRFESGSGVSIDPSGKLNGISVNSAPGKSLEELSARIPNKQIGVTTVEKIREAGGEVVPAPTANNPYHCLLCGITARDAERLFAPTTRNPNVP